MPKLTTFEVFVRFEVTAKDRDKAEEIVDTLMADLIQKPDKVKMPSQIGDFAIDYDQTAEVEE